MFHISWKNNRANILKKGLLPKIKEFPELQREPGIYLMETQEQAEDWAYYFGMTYSTRNKTAIDIWKVNLPESTQLHQDLTDVNEVYDSWFTFEPIHPENLQVIYTMRYFGPDFDLPVIQKVNRNV
jgi:hypothetical protein